MEGDPVPAIVDERLKVDECPAGVNVRLPADAAATATSVSSADWGRAGATWTTINPGSLVPAQVRMKR